MGLPPLRNEPPPDSLGPPRNDGATRPGRREPLGREIARAMRIETVINAAVIWAAAPACSARKNSGPRISKDRTCRNSFRIRRAQPPGDGGAGAPVGFQVAGEAFDAGAADGEQAQRAGAAPG